MDGYDLTGKSDNKSARGRYQKRKVSIAVYILMTNKNKIFLLIIYQNYPLSDNKSARGRYQKRKVSIAVYIFQNILNDYILEHIFNGTKNNL